MEERQEKVEEKPATYRKKIQYYAFGTFGVILIILFINMVISIASRNEEEPKENAKQETASTAPNTTEKINALIRLEIRIVPVMEIRIVKQIKNLFTLTAGKKSRLRRGGR